MSSATPRTPCDEKAPTIMMKRVRIFAPSVLLLLSSGTMFGQFSGSFDVANCNVLAGWAVNSSTLYSTISVDLYDGASLVATFPADQYRGDLAGIGNGVHAFQVNTPWYLLNGQTHSLYIHAHGSNTILTYGSPKSLTCSPPAYSGSLDAAGCSTLVGWVYDSNHPADR